LSSVFFKKSKIFYKEFKMSNLYTLKVKRLKSNAIVPTLAHKGEDIAIDLHSCDTDYLLPGEVKRFDTGIAIEFFPAAGAIVRTRSGMASQGLQVLGGMIDAGYRGSVAVILFNGGKEAYYIKEGDRIAQMRRCPTFDHEIIEVEELSHSKRGDKGFGSTGK
jgi:dUTP pyrophosphatase